MLKCKTRGNSSPNGKPNVYFSCHSKDFARFFESISDEILKLQNCAIWYDETLNEDYDKESLFDDLSQMQLIVIPVTSRFLRQKCRAREAEFQYAIEHNIPVLPLMQELGLEREFNQICGDLQYLTNLVNDITEIPYMEKLDRYLQSVLIGDELAEKIRSAFDAYVFLSYRKKDRKHAQELMRLIHDNEFCRDIAIWYDEFLTPGENFNQSILSALQKSSLFAMVVTPNLVNEINYIMTTEYPLANEQGKSILPVQMVSTNQDELKKNYENIPDCVDVRDRESLRKALLHTIQSLATREKDSSPEHLFFIGLAYLGGVDMEVDHEKALKLIMSAAEAGLTEAIIKLVNMYQTGNGVKKDFDTAIRWQKKLTQIYENAFFDNKKGKKELKKYLDAMFDLGDLYYEKGIIREGAKETYNRLSAFCEVHAVRTKDDNYGGWEYLYLSMSYYKLGETAISYGDFNDAKKWHEKALKVREQMAEKDASGDFQMALCTSYYRLGYIFEKLIFYFYAGSLYRKSLEVIEKLLTVKKDSVELKFHLATCYGKIGDVYLKQGEVSYAKECQEKALAIREALAEETGSIMAHRNLVLSYQSLGDIALSLKDSVSAREWYNKALDLCNYYFKEVDDVRFLGDVSVTYEKIGDACLFDEDLGDAENWYHRAYSCFNTLRKRTDIDSHCEFCRASIKIGDIYRECGALDMARDYYERARTILWEYVREKENFNTVRYIISGCYAGLSKLNMTEGNLKIAEEMAEKALEFIQGIHFEQNALFFTSKAEAFKLLADVYEKQGNIEKASENLKLYEHYREALPEKRDIIRELMAVQGTLDEQARKYEEQGDYKLAYKEYLEEIDIMKSLVMDNVVDKYACKFEYAANHLVLMDVYCQLAKMMQKQGEEKDAILWCEKAAIQWYEEAAYTGKKLLQIEEDPENLREAGVEYLHTIYADLAELYRKQGDDYNIIKISEKYFSTNALWMESGISETDRREVCNSYITFGDHLVDDEKYDIAIMYYEKALPLFETLTMDTGSIEDRFAQSTAYGRLGKVEEIRGEFKKAKQWYGKSLEINKALREETGRHEYDDSVKSTVKALKRIDRALNHSGWVKKWWSWIKK